MTATRPSHSPQRDRAWGRYYARRGLDVVANSYIAPMSNHMRIALYQIKRAGYIDTSRFFVYH